jgi:hypothetical protein
MNPITAAANLLRDLPAPLRKTIYTVLALVGALLAGLVAVGVDTIGPLTVDRMLQVYAYLSPLMGAVAFANVTPGEGDELPLVDFDEDSDLSSFEPVGDETDVFAGATS